MEGKGGGEGEGGAVALIHCNTDQIQCSNLSFKATDLQITSLTAALLCTKLENAQNSCSSAVRMQPAALVYQAGRPRSRSRGSDRLQRIGTGRAGSPGSLCAPLGPGAQPVPWGRGEPGGPKAARSQSGRGVAAPAPRSLLAGSSKELPGAAVPAESRRLWAVGPCARRRPAALLFLLPRYRSSGTFEPPLPPPLKPRPPRLPRRRAVRPRAPSPPSVSFSFFPSHSVFFVVPHCSALSLSPVSVAVPALTLPLSLFLSLPPSCLSFSFFPIFLFPLPLPSTILSLSPPHSTPSSPSLPIPLRPADPELSVQHHRTPFTSLRVLTEAPRGDKRVLGALRCRRPTRHLLLEPASEAGGNRGTVSAWVVSAALYNSTCVGEGLVYEQRCLGNMAGW